MSKKTVVRRVWLAVAVVTLAVAVTGQWIGSRMEEERFEITAFFCGCHDCHIVAQVLKKRSNELTVFYSGDMRSSLEFGRRTGLGVQITPDPNGAAKAAHGVKYCPALVIKDSDNNEFRFGDEDPLDVSDLRRILE